MTSSTVRHSWSQFDGQIDLTTIYMIAKPWLCPQVRLTTLYMLAKPWVCPAEEHGLLQEAERHSAIITLEEDIRPYAPTEAEVLDIIADYWANWHETRGDED